MRASTRPARPARRGRAAAFALDQRDQRGHGLVHLQDPGVVAEGGAACRRRSARRKSDWLKPAQAPNRPVGSSGPTSSWPPRGRRVEREQPGVVEDEVGPEAAVASRRRPACACRARPWTSNRRGSGGVPVGSQLGPGGAPVERQRVDVVPRRPRSRRRRRSAGSRRGPAPRTGPTAPAAACPSA